MQIVNYLGMSIVDLTYWLELDAIIISFTYSYAVMCVCNLKRQNHQRKDYSLGIQFSFDAIQIWAILWACDGRNGMGYEK